jgi:hypothetical protein
VVVALPSASYATLPRSPLLSSQLQPSLLPLSVEVLPSLFT